MLDANFYCKVTLPMPREPTTPDGRQWRDSIRVGATLMFRRLHDKCWVWKKIPFKITDRLYAPGADR